jgi:serine/threonine protein kinase
MEKRYDLLEQIGSGNFGLVYKGKNKRTGDFVAIKVEPIANQTKLLKNESTFYQFLKDTVGIPTIKWFGKDEVNYYMVLDLLGPSLDQLKREREAFSLRLTLQVGIQIINLLMCIHEKGLVHRDIKPDNFLLGLTDKQLYLIDFGFCKTFVRENRHIPPGKTNNIIGTLNYASINAHDMCELSRRDDMESLGYLMFDLLQGKLKWTQNQNNSNEKIRAMKCDIIVKNDTTIPNILVNYMKIIRALAFDEKPNYYVLIEMFKQTLSCV